MAHKLREERFKGWTKKELHHAQKIFDTAEKKKTSSTKRIDVMTYWLLLILGIAGAVLFAGITLPLSYILPDLVLWPLSLFLGLLYSQLFISLLHDLHWISRGAKFLTAITFGVAAMIAFFVFAQYSGTNFLITGFLFLTGLFSKVIKEANNA